MVRLSIVLLSIAVTLLASTPRATAGFALRPHDRVVFLGDSNTAAEESYVATIARYVMLRFPGRRIRILNAGVGGDTAATALARLERDVFARRATVVVVVLGINDVRWGMAADAAHVETHLAAMRSIVEHCAARGVRVVVVSYPASAGDWDAFRTMADRVLALAASHGASPIDAQRTMRDIARRLEAHNAGVPPDRRVTLHRPDGVHLNALGQLALAYAILRGLGAPRDVSSVTIDARRPAVVEATGTVVTDLQAGQGTLAFTRRDAGTPMTLGAFAGLTVLPWVPFTDALGRYRLAVRDLPPGRWALEVDGRPLAAFSAAELADGVDLSALRPDPWIPTTPWDVHSTILDVVTASTSRLAAAQRLADALPAEAAGRRRLQRALGRAVARVEAAGRVVAAPQARRFVLRPAS